jgi:hypothetical protein
LRAAVDENRVRRRSRTIFAPAEDRIPGGADGTGSAAEPAREPQHQ